MMVKQMKPLVLFMWVMVDRALAFISHGILLLMALLPTITIPIPLYGMKIILVGILTMF